MEPVLILITLFAAIFGILYMYYSTRHKERLALIEKGADASLFNTGVEASKSRINWSRTTLKIGMLFMGIAIGVVIGALLTKAGLLNVGANYVSMIFFFGGLSLVLFYFLVGRK